jgi:hypothetical protein
VLTTKYNGATTAAVRAAAAAEIIVEQQQHGQPGDGNGDVSVAMLKTTR